MISDFWRQYFHEPPELPDYLDPEHPYVDVFYLALLGLSNEEIGAEFGETLRNVRYYMSLVLELSGQPDRAHLIAASFRDALL